MTGQSTADEKRMKLRYAGTCRICAAELPARAEAIYERSTKTVRCVAHDAVAAAELQTVQQPEPVLSETEPIEIDPGIPGGSARREFERRKTAREERIRAKHPKVGGLTLALSEDPQSTRAWDIGAAGEEKLGRQLDGLASESLRVLHDRRIPRSRANIDHLAVTPTGVYVIDAKKYKGRPSLKVEGGILRPRVERLLVGTRDCTKLVDGVLAQVDVVRSVVGDDVPVHGVLCFVEADWPLIGGSFATRGVDVLWPRKLHPKLRESGPLDTEAIAEAHAMLASALSPA